MRGLDTMGGKCPTPMDIGIRQTTFTERLVSEKAELERRLKDINTVLESLKNAPEVAKVIESLHKLGY